MKKISNQVILIIILPIIFGFLAGILGYVFLGLNGVNLPFFGQINFSNIDINRQIVIDQPRQVVVEQDLQFKQVENNLLPTLVNIYPLKKSANVLNQAYLPSERLGQGFALTADGWIVTTKGVLNNFKNNYAAVGYQLKEYKLEKFVEDKVSGVVFAKAEAANLPVVRIGRSKELFVGQTLILASGREQLTLVHIKKIGYDFKTAGDLIQSSEKLNKSVFLDVDLNETYNGAVLANLKGEVVGIVNNQRVIMADYFSNIIDQVLKTEKISRSSAGISYLDLAQTEGLVAKGDKGALVYGNPVRPSPVFGLIKDGDIITKMDNIEINAYQSLSELLNTYRPGDSVEFLINRGGEEVVVEVILK